MFDTFDQPLGGLLFRDGFALVSFTVGDEELSFVLVPDVTSTQQILDQSLLGTESACHTSICKPYVRRLVA